MKESIWHPFILLIASIVLIYLGIRQKKTKFEAEWNQHINKEIGRFYFFSGLFCLFGAMIWVLKLKGYLTP